MKITVDWDVLQREHILIGDFLVLLMGYYGADYKNPSSQSPIALAAIIHLHILPQFWLYGKTLRQFGGRFTTISAATGSGLYKGFPAYWRQ